MAKSTSTEKVKRVWRKGPPPHVGWWNASKTCDWTCWRWWDGERWSWPAYEKSPKEEMELIEKEWPTNQNGIVWNDYYPTNARVPRTKP